MGAVPVSLGGVQAFRDSPEKAIESPLFTAENIGAHGGARRRSSGHRAWKGAIDIAIVFAADQKRGHLRIQPPVMRFRDFSFSTSGASVRSFARADKGIFALFRESRDRAIRVCPGQLKRPRWNSKREQEGQCARLREFALD